MENGNLDIIIKGLVKGKPKLKGDGFICSLLQNKKTLKELEVYNKFIKSTERLVRTSKEYRKYKDYLINDIGLNYCQVFPNINLETSPNVTLEMHHGPILTLFDCCAIMADHMIYNEEDLTSIILYDKVLEEHRLNNIQVVMLCDLAHKLVHANQVYLNPKQGWGNIDNFLKKYKDGITDKREIIINRNIEIASKYHSNDRDDILKVDKILRWDNRE